MASRQPTLTHADDDDAWDPRHLELCWQHTRTSTRTCRSADASSNPGAAPHVTTLQIKAAPHQHQPDLVVSGLLRIEDEEEDEGDSQYSVGSAAIAAPGSHGSPFTPCPSAPAGPWNPYGAPPADPDASTCTGSDDSSSGVLDRDQQQQQQGEGQRGPAMAPPPQPQPLLPAGRLRAGAFLAGNPGLQAGAFLAGNPGLQGSNLFARLGVLLQAGLFDEFLPSTTDRWGHRGVGDGRA